jgi:hypothetical protein
MKKDNQKIIKALLEYDHGKYFDKFPIVTEYPKTHKRYIADPTAFFLAVLLKGSRVEPG